MAEHPKPILRGLIRRIKSPTEYTQSLITETIGDIRKRYGVDVKLGDLEVDQRANLISTAPDTHEAHQGVTALSTELSKYPPDYFQASGLVKVILVNSLRDNKEDMGGIALLDGSGVIYVVVNRYDPEFTEQTVHHELEHQAGFTFSKSRDVRVFFKDRHSLIPTTVQHLDWQNHMERHGERYVGKRWARIPDAERTGFARTYGKSNISEDQATIMEYIMVLHEELAERLPDDPLLATKVASMKAELKRRTNGRMNEQYFADLQAGRVGLDYWDTH